jgi:8-amino-7-oxononanoate synthase
MAKQIRAALRLSLAMDKEREELHLRAKRLAAGLRSQGWDTGSSSTQIVPIVIGGNKEALAAAEFLQQEGFAVRAIRPPTVPQGSARLRFSLTCAIADEELNRLEDCLNVWRDHPYRSAAVGRA